MATSNISGLGSGIDFGTIRDAIIASRARPITQLQNKSTTYSNRVDALKQLNTVLATLTNAADALGNKDLGTGRNTLSSDSSVVTANGTSAAALGQFDITVTRLATNLAQASHNFTSANDAVLADGATSATFELRKGGATSGTAITINAANNTLSGLRDAINNANAGVTAAIVDLSGDGTKQQLVLSSTASGTAGRVELVETTSTGTAAALSLRTLSPVDGDLTKLDAAFSINGLAVTRSSNSVTDAVTGVTLNLKKAGSANIQVTAATDIKAKLDSFVDAYNAVQDFVANQYKKDAKNRPTGVLAGDSVLLAVQRQLREALGNISNTNGGAFTSLSDIGIGRDNDGRLTFDASVYSDKVKTNLDDVRALLVGKTAEQTGFAKRFYGVSSGLSDSVTGSVQGAIKGYQDSINRISDTINSKIESINRLRDSLTKQFAAADAAIGQLNGQNTSLTSIIKSLQNSSSNN